MMLVLLAGCEKEIPQPKPVPGGQDGFVTLTLTAQQNAESKTHLGTPGDASIPVLWDADDQIWVRSGAQEAGTPGNCFTTSAEALSSDGKTAKFTGESLEEGPYVAVYPYSFVAAESGNSSVVLNVPSTQAYAEKSFSPGANYTAAVWSSGTSMTFKHIAGAMRLKFTGTKKVKSIKITDNDPAKALWGKCTLNIDGQTGEVSSTSWENADPGKNSLILDCGEGVQLKETEDTEFYLVVPVGAFAKGFTCTLTADDDSVIKTLKVESDCSIRRGIIADMASIAPEDTPFSGGKGTAESPYRISTPEDLVQLAGFVNGGDAAYNAASYVQVNDIDMDGVSIDCIGSQDTAPFKGSYDGKDFTVKNLSPAASAKASGMFGYATGATLKDISIKDYTNAGTAGNQGALVGYATDCNISGVKVEGTIDFVKCACGGVAGYVEGGSISNCSVSGFIHNEDTDTFQGVTVVSCVGGIAGYAHNATIDGCVFDGHVTSKGEQLGGIAGQINSTTISNCEVTSGSTVTGDNYYVGGIAGEMLVDGSIKNCTVNAHVICWYPGAAGIVAWMQSGEIDGCVVGPDALVRTGQDKAGGIVAYIYHKNTAQTVNISNCEVYCDVAASYSVGGIVGECNPTDNSTKVNIWNCAYQGGEIIDAGQAASNWTMIGGLVAWARMGSTTAELNIVNCFCDPEAIRCDFPWSNEVDMGGFIGEQGGANASVNIQGCYNTLAYGTAIINGKRDIAANYFNYGALIGNPTKTNFDHVYYINSLAGLGKANSGTSKSLEAYSPEVMAGSTLLGNLNAFVSAYSGPLSLKTWVGGRNCYPVLEGMAPVKLQKDSKALRVSLIGDSLSTFDGYAPHGYQASRAANGYRCHYPTGDGNVTSAAQTYWYMLTYDYLSNAVWDTNLAFSGTAVTRCTNSSYSSQYWYGQDFCTRYIENGGMGNPDIIIINGGANDWAHGIYPMLGSQMLVRYPTTTPHRPSDSAMEAVYAVADACKTLDEAKALPDASFVEAYVKLVKMMTLQYPHVKIVVLIHDTLTPDVEEALIHIANHYSKHCRYVDLYAVNGFNDFGWDFEYLFKGYQPNMPKHDLNWDNIYTTGDLRRNCSDHYSAQAMKFIAEKIYNELGTWLESSASYNESGDGSISNFDNINGKW